MAYASKVIYKLVNIAIFPALGYIKRCVSSMFAEYVENRVVPSLECTLHGPSLAVSALGT